MKTGRIFNIQRFSTHDGPGIRTTVFFKGCNLRCLWCHNPESYRAGGVMQYFKDKCVHCGECARVCPKGIHVCDDHREGADGTDAFSECLLCRECEKVCLTGALKYSGEEYSCDELLGILKKDMDYYDASGGGVTASGGEPLLQADFVGELFAGLQEAGIRTALDSAGNVPFTSFEKVLPFTDLVLLDIKAMDDAVHRKCTGASNALILENAKRLMRLGVPMHIRVPIIPGLNDDPYHFDMLHDLLKDASCIEEIRFLPYHAMGLAKAESVGESMERYNTPDDARMETIRSGFRDLSARIT